GPTTSSLTEIDPQPGSQRSSTAIGGSRVAFLDSGDVLIHDLVTHTTTSLSNNNANDVLPNVAPDGNIVVWMSCDILTSHCGILAAFWQANVNAWSGAITISNSVGNPENPDTDGAWLVYDDDCPSATGQDIYITRVGGVEQHLVIPGADRNPSISQG